MSKTHKDKQYPTQKSILKTDDINFEEKKRAAYSQMGQLRGMARAKQMAENGFPQKTRANSLSNNKNSKDSLETEEKKHNSPKKLSQKKVIVGAFKLRKERTRTIHIIKISWRKFKDKIKKTWGQFTHEETPPTAGIL